MIKLVHSAILLFSLSLSRLAVAEGGDPGYRETIAAAAITTGGKVDVEKFTSAKTFLFVASRSDCSACERPGYGEKKLQNAGVLVVILSKDKDKAAMHKYIGKRFFTRSPAPIRKSPASANSPGLRSTGFPMLSWPMLRVSSSSTSTVLRLGACLRKPWRSRTNSTAPKTSFSKLAHNPK
ncbi:MAG: hypothetical protein RL095_3436 [Verrucomicrobiota bacterium]